MSENSLRLVAALTAAVVLFLGVDALLFRTPLYPSILEPNSSTGLFELTLKRELRNQEKAGDNLIVTFGNSRFGYSTKSANALTPASGLFFGHAGVAGSDARTWYYMLRDLDPGADRYRAIVFGVDDYADDDAEYELADDIRSLHYVIIRLRLSDVLDFAGSFRNRRLQWEAVRGALFKGFVLQRDVQAFLSHPVERIRYVRLSDRFFATWTNEYMETSRNMAGLEIDWNKWTVRLPPNADDAQRDTVKHFLMRRPARPDGHIARFRREWFGRILDRYRRSRTRIVFLRLPRGPVARPEELSPKGPGVIREFASRPNVVLLDEHAFDALNHPEYFKDAMHLNREGVARFTPLLVEQIGHAL